MKIKYFQNGTLTIGVADYSDEEFFVNSIDKQLLFLIFGMCSSVEKKQLLNQEKFTAYAKPANGDTFDPNIGKEIVKRKLIVKDAERTIQKMAIIEKHLLELVKVPGVFSNKALDRMNMAYEELEGLA